jgi:hypothetical protein
MKFISFTYLLLFFTTLLCEFQYGNADCKKDCDRKYHNCIEVSVKESCSFDLKEIYEYLIRLAGIMDAGTYMLLAETTVQGSDKKVKFTN